MRSLNIQWDGTWKCSLGLDWDPKTEIHQCSVVRQKMWLGKKGGKSGGGHLRPVMGKSPLKIILMGECTDYV